VFGAALASDVMPTWRGGERIVITDADGIEHNTISMPQLEIGRELTTLMSCIYEAQLVMPFDWISWRLQSQFAYGIDPEAAISVGDAVRLLTTICRSCRFNEGAFGRAFTDAPCPS